MSVTQSETMSISVNRLIDIDLANKGRFAKKEGDGMADREKIIKKAEEALEFLAPDDKHRLHMGITMELGWIYDVISLLKEQEVIPTRNIQDRAVCKCGLVLCELYNYCPECGKRINLDSE